MFQQFYSDSEAPFWRFFCDTRILAWQEVQAARAGLIRLLEGYQARNPMLVTDAGVAATAFFKAFVGDLGPGCLLVGAEGEMAPLRRFADDANATSADLLIAVGGGSVLDAAKCLAVCLPSGTPPEALLRLKHAPERVMPLICVPTTFGTGSEVNNCAHLHLPQGKVSFKRQWLAPAVALLVGEAGCELSQRARYLTAVDAWVHALEALTLKREHSPFQEALMRQALALHERHLPAWLAQGNAADGLAIATASCLGGLGINNARTGLIHALATPFAAQTGLPHNQSLLPFIDPVLAFHHPVLALRFGQEFPQSISAFRKGLQPMAQTIMMDPAFSVPEAAIAAMAQAVQQDRVLFKENPVPLDQDLLEQLFRQSLFRV